MNKFTPGPWKVFRAWNFIDVSGICRVHRQRAQSDKVCGRFKHDRTSLANAQLLASSPELLEALEQSLKIAESTLPYQVWSSHFIKMRIVIAKAKGEL